MRRKATFLIVLMLVTISLNAQKFKYGHVNADEILMKMPEVIVADSLIKKQTEEYQKQINKMQEEYTQKATDLNQNAESMSDLMKQTKIDELKSLDERIKKFQISAQEDILKLKNKLLTPVNEKFNKALKNVAKKQGYKFIIDQRYLLYSEDAEDATQFILSELNIK